MEQRRRDGLDVVVFFSSRRRHTRFDCDWSSDVCSSDLERAGLKPEDIDLIITVSCTGFMIPSLDAHLIHLMGFRPNVRRMPFTELGCEIGRASCRERV